MTKNELQPNDFSLIIRWLKSGIFTFKKMMNHFEMTEDECRRVLEHIINDRQLYAEYHSRNGVLKLSHMMDNSFYKKFAYYETEEEEFRAPRPQVKIPSYIKFDSEKTIKDLKK